MSDEIHEQLLDYLRDAHAIEEQALAQLREAPKIAGDDGRSPPRSATTWPRPRATSGSSRSCSRPAARARPGSRTRS